MAPDGIAFALCFVDAIVSVRGQYPLAERGYSR